MKKSNGDREESSSSIPNKRVNYYLEELLQRKGPKREEALASIVEILRSSSFKLELDFLDNNFATFLYRCLNTMKKGSTKELQSASQAIGLLAMIINVEDNENEIYRESLPVVSKALKSGPKALKVFDCLGIGTFFGATNSEEAQTTMQTIWTLIHPESDSDVKGNKQSPEILAAAVSAWIFLLTSLEGWSISSKYWQGSVSYFVNLLEEDDQAISVAAGYGLALIFEKGSVDKFCSKEEKKEESSTSQTYSCIKESIKDSVVEKLERLCLRQGSEDESVKIRKQYDRILNYFKTGSCQKISVSFGKDTLVLPSWSKIIQLNYLKSFLGDHGLNVHMRENQKLQAVFDFIPTKSYVPRKELYEPAFEEVTINCYLPKERDLSSLLSAGIKKDKIMRSSIVDKAKTQLRSKNRKLAEERKHVHDFD